MTDNTLYNISVLTVFTCVLNWGPSEFFLVSDKPVSKDTIPILAVDCTNHELHIIPSEDLTSSAFEGKVSVTCGCLSGSTIIASPLLTLQHLHQWG